MLVLIVVGGSSARSFGVNTAWLTWLDICYTGPMNIEFTGTIWFWNGPAPWYFVTVPAEQSRDLNAISGFVTYGWGVLPVHVRTGNTAWTTSVFPKDGHYIVPIKARVRTAEHLEEGDPVTLHLEVRHYTKRVGRGRGSIPQEDGRDHVCGMSHHSTSIGVAERKKRPTHHSSGRV